MTAPRCTRRRALAGLLSGASIGIAVPASADTWRERADHLIHALSARLTGAGPPGATLLVGGPTDGMTAQLAGMIAPLIAPTLLGLADGKRADGTGAPPRVDVTPTGGLDGVTAANAFEARANPDGSTALVVPGKAALAWLAGDPRVHFDAGLWVPAMATLSSAVLVRRADATIARGATVVLGGNSPAGPALPALLALHLLGTHVSTRFGSPAASAEPGEALRSGAVDAVMIAGADVPRRVAQLAAAGCTPVCAFGPGAGTPGASRDPALPDVQTFDELYARTAGARLPAHPLVAALRASAAATRLDAAVVLPQLAPAATVARWREACGAATASLSLQSATRARAISPAAAPDCVDAVRAVVADETTLLELHRMLADRWGWRPA